MEHQSVNETADIALEDLQAFKLAVGASLSLTAARVQGLDVTIQKAPSFPIEVDGRTYAAFVSGTAQCHQGLDSVIVYFDDTTADQQNVRHYALAWPAEDSDDWSFSRHVATDNFATDNFKTHPEFYLQAMSDQLSQLEG